MVVVVLVVVIAMSLSKMCRIRPKIVFVQVHQRQAHALLPAGLDPHRLSFVAALRVIGDAIPEFQMVPLAQ